MMPKKREKRTIKSRACVPLSTSVPKGYTDENPLLLKITLEIVLSYSQSNKDTFQPFHAEKRYLVYRRGILTIGGRPTR